MKRIGLIKVLMCFFISINGQSVDSLIEMAFAYNPAMKALQLEYEAALEKSDQVNDWPDPNVSLGIGVLPVETRFGAQRLKIGVSQMIPWKGHLNAKSNVMKSMAEVQSGFDELKAIDIEYAIRARYSTLQYLKSKKNIIREKLNVLEALEELAKSSLRSGKGKLSNVLFTERKKELLQTDLELITKKMEQPTIMINRWIGRDLYTEIDVSVYTDQPLSKMELMAFASNDHPQHKIFENEIAASDSRIYLTEYDSKPKIGVGLEYAYIDARNDIDVPGNGRDLLMPMGSVSIPLNTGRYKSIRQEEKIKKQAIQARKKEAMDIFRAEIDLAFATIEYSDQVKEKYLSLKNITKETIKLLRIEYASEGTRFEELLRLELELIDYDLAILNAMHEKNLAMASLNKYN